MDFPLQPRQWESPEFDIHSGPSFRLFSIYPNEYSPVTLHMNLTVSSQKGARISSVIELTGACPYLRKVLAS